MSVVCALCAMHGEPGASPVIAIHRKDLLQEVKALKSTKVDGGKHFVNWHKVDVLDAFVRAEATGKEGQGFQVCESVQRILSQSTFTFSALTAYNEAVN